MTAILSYLRHSALFFYHRLLEACYPLAEQVVLHSRQTSPQLLDLSAKKRYKVVPGAPECITLILVGCGGTGSFAAHTLAQFTRWSLDQGVDTRLYFVDPDHVEPKNLNRQNFCPAEIGLPKAFTLAWRYSAALGLKITSFVQPFDLQLLLEATPQGHQRGNGALTIVVGAVDNYCARRDIADALTNLLTTSRYSSAQHQCWWIDAGNELHNGQVIIGNSLKEEPQLSPLGYCMALPLPHIQEPSLIIARAQPPPPDEALSCAELTTLGDQSAMINRVMATWIGIYLYRLLKECNLDIHSTFTNILTGVTRSTPISHGTTISVSDVAQQTVPPQRVQALVPPHLIEGEDAPDRCPDCEHGVLIDGEDQVAGVLVRIRFCDTCTYSTHVCPECGGQIITNEINLDPDDDGADTEELIRCLETLVYCDECEWSMEVAAGEMEDGYCPGPVMVEPEEVVQAATSQQ